MCIYDVHSKKTWIGDLTALVTLSNILIKQVEAKKSMFKKNWFQASGYEQEKALLTSLLSKIERHSTCSQEDNNPIPITDFWKVFASFHTFFEQQP